MNSASLIQVASHKIICNRYFMMIPHLKQNIREIKSSLIAPKVNNTEHTLLICMLLIGLFISTGSIKVCKHNMQHSKLVSYLKRWYSSHIRKLVSTGHVWFLNTISQRGILFLSRSLCAMKLSSKKNPHILPRFIACSGHHKIWLKGFALRVHCYCMHACVNPCLQMWTQTWNWKWTWAWICVHVCILWIR